MKRTLWVVSSVAVLALPVGAIAALATAGSRTADLGTLQQAISSMSVVDLTATQRAECFKDCKTHTHCNVQYLCQKCQCP